ncbi:MAG: Rho termination factor N-terminal domain-containing protein, partial [Balneolales bacterium]|nr:Rho termination factor N-terminal domain-containing protein [Balneolales bacterium]
MNKKTVRELRAIAKSSGLTRYSALRKADLIKLLVESTPPSSSNTTSKRKISFVLPNGQEYVPPKTSPSSNGGTIPPTPAPRTKRPTPAPRTKRPVPAPRPTPAPRTQKTFQRGKEIVSNFIQSGVELVEALPKKVPKAFDWLKNQTTKVVVKAAKASSSLSDMISKNLMELTGNRETKPNKSVKLSELVKKELGSQSRFSLVEGMSSLRKFAKQYTIDVSQRGFTDLREFLSVVQPTITAHLRENRNVKAKLVVECVMAKMNIATGNKTVSFTFFHGFTESIFEGTNLGEFYHRSVEKIMESLSRFQSEGSNWTIESIENVTLHTVRHNPLSGSSYIPLPAKIKNKGAIINMKNEDNECFKWCVTRALNPVDKNAERISKILRKQSLELNWEGLKWPMELKDIHKFERLNEITVNVLGLDGTEVYPLRLSKSNHPTEINLLLIHDDKKQHYCLIKDMSRLLASQTTKNERKEFYCMRCLNSFGRRDLLDDHKELCGQHEEVKVIMPKEGSSVSFGHFHKKIDVPFVIYADFESLMKAFHSAQPNPDKSYTMKLQKHNPDGFSYFIKCTFDDKYDKLVEYTATSEDEDVSQRFVDELEKEVKSIYTS